METKNINEKNANVKAGKNNVKHIFTSASAAAAAGLAGGWMASSAFTEKAEEEHVQETESQPAEGNVQPTEAVASNAPDSQTEMSDEELEELAAAILGESDSSVEEHIDSVFDENPNTETAESETPQETTEATVQTTEIDAADNDAPAVVEIEGFTTVYDEDGNEISAALAHAGDGTLCFLADTDGDGIYEGVYDFAGNFIAQAEANLTHSDLELMIDASGDYLAIDAADEEQNVETSTEDIIDTDTGEHIDVTQDEPTDEDIDNLLAELLGSDVDSDSGSAGNEVLVDETCEEDLAEADLGDDLQNEEQDDVIS